MATQKTDAEWDAFYSAKEESPLISRLDRIIALLEAQRSTNYTTINVADPTSDIANRVIAILKDSVLSRR